MSKIAVVGSRSFKDYDLLRNILMGEIMRDSDTVIISGGARGADILAEAFADSLNLPKIIILPEWDRYGKRAGFIRNQLIVNKADKIIAFWDGESKGTAMTIRIARDLEKPVRIIRVDKNGN